MRPTEFRTTTTHCVNSARAWQVGWSECTKQFYSVKERRIVNMILLVANKFNVPMDVWIANIIPRVMPKIIYGDKIVRKFVSGMYNICNRSGDVMRYDEPRSKSVRGFVCRNDKACCEPSVLNAYMLRYSEALRRSFVHSEIEVHYKLWALATEKERKHVIDNAAKLSKVKSFKNILKRRLAEKEAVEQPRSTPRRTRAKTSAH